MLLFVFLKSLQFLICISVKVYSSPPVTKLSLLCKFSLEEIFGLKIWSCNFSVLASGGSMGMDW